MKTTTVLKCLPFFGIISVLSAAKPPIDANSNITEATVYMDRAIVTREALVSLPLGESYIILSKLPAQLLDASIQVSGRGSAEATILDVATPVTYVADTSGIDRPEVKALENEIESLKESLLLVEDRRLVLQQQSALLDKIENSVASPPAEGSPVRPAMEDMQQLLSFSLERRRQLTKDARALGNEQKELQKKLQAASSQLSSIRQRKTSSKSYKSVVVRVAAENPGDLNIKVSYTVYGPSWTPVYDVRLRSEKHIVELAYNAIVRQSTGEDWSNVALTLSTAKPSLGGAAPTLSPWILDIFTQPPPAPLGGILAQSRQRKDVYYNGQAFNYISGDSEALVAYDDAPREQEARIALATVDNTTTSASFKIKASTSIPSNNTPQKVSITKIDLPARLQYQATPAMQETAFLSSYVSNDTEFPFLAGSSSIFLDDAFVASSSLKTVMPSEKFEIPLGADEGVAIKRRIVNRFTENTGIINKGRRVTYEFLVTITNNKKTKERIVFKEALPLSRNEKIVVKLLSPDSKTAGTLEKPGKEVTLEEENKLVWRIDLQPGEKREVTFKFSIEYPEGIQVEGLN